MQVILDSQQIECGNKSDQSIEVVTMKVGDKDVFNFSESNFISSDLNLGSFSDSLLNIPIYDYLSSS